MKKKSLATLFLVFILVFFVVSLSVSQILAVPLWWIFSFMHPLNVLGPSTLLVKVSPETPLNIGEKITVTVTNSSSQLPVEDAEVSIMKDGTNITVVHTDSRGQAVCDYLGEVTIIVVQKTGFDSSYPIPIPKMPDAWVRSLLTSVGSAIVGGLVAVFGTYMLRERKEVGKITRKRKK